MALPVVAHAAADCPPRTGDGAADERSAREQFERALRLEPAEPEAALDALECAETLASKPAVALRIGTIEERLGHAEAAAQAFERYLERAGEHAPDATQMRGRIARLRAQATPSGGPPPAPPPGGGDTQAVVGWVLAGSGLALAITGGVLLGVAKAHSDQVHDIEPLTTTWDSDEARGTYEAAELEQALGIIGLITGGTVGLLGVILVATTPDGRAVALEGAAGPGVVGGTVRGSF